MTHSAYVFNVPISWSWAKVRDITEVIRGASPRPKGDPRYFGGDIPWIMISDISRQPGKYLTKTKEGVTEAGSRLSRLLPPGSLILSNSGTVCVPKILRIEGCIHDGFVTFPTLPDEISRDYLYYWFDYIRSKVVQQNKQGITQVNLNTEIVRELDIPVPPTSEQRRIVAKIEELFSDLDAGVAALERIRANLKRYRAAVLKAAVEGKLSQAWRAKQVDAASRRVGGECAETGSTAGVKATRQDAASTLEPATKLLDRILAERRQKWEENQLAKFAAAGKPPPKGWREKYIEPAAPDTNGLPELPPGWCWVSMEQLLVYLRNGYFQSPSGADHGTPILRINAVRPMSVDLSESRFLDSISDDAKDYFIDNGDLLFTRYNGSIDLLGVAGLVRGCNGKILHPDKLIRVRLALGQPLSDFVEIAANIGVSRKHMVGRARTTAGQTGISGTDIREMPIPLPPLEEQSAIVAEVSERLSQITAADILVRHGLLRAARLRQSILKRAFEGKLVPQDPNDEPAEKLLERIRSARETASGRARETTSGGATNRKPRQRTKKK